MSTVAAQYERQIDAARGSDSLSRIARMIRPETTVLDVGTAHGALGGYLTEFARCTVDGIEVSDELAKDAAPHYRRMLVADIETSSLDTLGPGTYDYIVCADVLEHLREPALALRKLKPLLKPNGRFIISIPNIGYAGVVAALLGGEFRYRDAGLLDRTHLRFFTRATLLELLNDAGLAAQRFETVDIPLEQSEFAHFTVETLPPRVVAALEAGVDALTYQFVVEASTNGHERAEVVAGSSAPKHLSHFSAQLFWQLGEESASEEHSVRTSGTIGLQRQSLSFRLPAFERQLEGLRFDPSDRPGFFMLYSIELRDVSGRPLWTWDGDPRSILDGKSFGVEWQVRAGGVVAHCYTDDSGFMLPIPTHVLRTFHEPFDLIITCGWPMSADYAEAMLMVAERKRANELEGLHLRAHIDQLTKELAAERAERQKDRDAARQTIVGIERSYVTMQQSFRAELERSARERDAALQAVNALRNDLSMVREQLSEEIRRANPGLRERIARKLRRR